MCRAGGITETLRIARLADLFGVSWASHVSVSTPLHLAAGLHVGAATPNFLISEYPSGFDESPLGGLLADDAHELIEGGITISDTPGLGVVLNDEQVDRLTAHSGRRSRMP